MAEPLSVCLHAAHQAGPLLGKRVLVTGCGPIGALMVLVARYGGAAEIVVTDVADAPLAVARKLGASRALNVAADAAALDAWRAGKGTFDVLFEASGNQAALRIGARCASARRDHRAARAWRRDDPAVEHGRRQGIADSAARSASIASSSSRCA